MSFSIEHETDIERLRQVAKLMDSEIKVLLRRISELSDKLAQAEGNDSGLQLELKLLQEQLDRRHNDLFGRSSEKRSSTSADTKKDTKPQTGHGPTKQPELPVVEKIHDLDTADRFCPKCGGALSEMADQYEQSEEIDVIEREYRIVKHRRKKYTCRCGECVETALGPRKLISGGRYSIDFAVQVAIDKYRYHLPLYRQTLQMKAIGLRVGSQTLFDQLWAMQGHLRPTYEALRDHVLSAELVGADETTWPLLKTGKPCKWWAWAVATNDSVCYRILPSRSTDAAQQVLGDYRGIVVADGYGAYGALSNSRDGPSFVLANCWAHARRKFVECEKNYPQAKQAIEWIGRLYEVEKKARVASAKMDEKARLALLAKMRHEQSGPIIDELLQWLGSQSVLPKSGLGKAVKYVLKLWDGLTEFLDDPRIWLDNNHTEREMRPLAVGRKNHYGSKSKRGIEVAALFYSLIESARLCGLQPATYLKAAIERAIDNPGCVTLPHEFAKEQKENCKQSPTLQSHTA